MCPESIPTVSIVNRCPSNATEWVSAAKRKSCKDLGQLQSCTTADDFVYHCVLNKDATMLLEVCAPTYLMSGYCARFSEVEKRIIIDTGLDCTKFDPPCSSSFSSNESFKYQTCYRNAGEILEGCEVSRERNLHFTKPIVISVIFAIIILLILIITGVGCKLKMIKFANRKKSSKQNKRKEINDREMEDTEPLNEPRTAANIATPQQGGGQENYVQQENLRSLEEKKTMCYRSLSGEIIGDISLKGINTIGDVLDVLSRDLGIQRQFLFIVDSTTGQILQEEDQIKHLHIKWIELIIGNENRTKCFYGKDGGNVKTDVIDNKKLTSGKCQMSCGHFTDPDSLFKYAMRELPCSSDSSLPCPVCIDTFWNVDELVTKCNMSPDEELFFKNVAIINKRTNDLKKELCQSLPCLFTRDYTRINQKIGTARSLSEL